MNKVFIWCICSVISGLALHCILYREQFFFILFSFFRLSLVFLFFFCPAYRSSNFTIYSPLCSPFITVIVNTAPFLNVSFCWVAKSLGWGQFVPHCPIMPDACGYTIWSIHELIYILGHEFHTPSPLLLPGRFEVIMTLQQMKRTKIWWLTCGRGGVVACAEN